MKAVESIILFVFLIFFGACLEDDMSIESELSAGIKSYANVDRELWTHFQAFEKAAAERGFRVDLNRANIVGTLENIEEGGVAGTCSYGGRQNHKSVVIDASFWKRASHLYREYIVFHELGHCFLLRGHRESCLTNRTYASIMRSGTQSGCRDNYNVQTRDYYIDELMVPLEGA